MECGMFEQRVRRAILWEKMNLAGLFAFIDGFDGPGPADAIAVVDLAEIEQGFLNGPRPPATRRFSTTLQ